MDEKNKSQARKEQRLAEALRENLRKRKEQARERSGADLTMPKRETSESGC